MVKKKKKAPVLRCFGLFFRAAQQLDLCSHNFLRRLNEPGQTRVLQCLFVSRSTSWRSFPPKWFEADVATRRAERQKRAAKNPAAQKIRQRLTTCATCARPNHQVAPASRVEGRRGGRSLSPQNFQIEMGIYTERNGTKCAGRDGRFVSARKRPGERR